MKYDVVIIGAGILGSIIADNLCKYDLKVLVLEKGCDSGLEQSMSSSAIVHSGIDPKAGTLKAKYNLLGNRMMKQFCDELNVDYVQCGGYICAHNNEELKHLEQMYVQGYNRGIECKIISGDSLREVEPKVSSEILYALSMPTTGVVYPTEITVACLERAMNNQVVVKYQTTVESIEFANEVYTISTSDGDYTSNYIINSSGMSSDLIARMTDPNFEISIKPKRGEYFVTNNLNPCVSSVIYPVPNENGKGVLAVPTTHGNVLLGPNGVLQDDRSDDGTHTSDLKYVQDNVSKILESLPNDVIKTYAGLRTSGNNGDFYLAPCKVTKNMYNLVAIDSPGIASAPAIGKEVSEWLVNNIDASLKVDYNPERPRYLKLSEYCLDSQNKIIAENEQFGKIICRCEQISEGEIRAAIQKQNGARNLTGVKFRIRPMLGMCQGGFCETEVVRILADELEVNINQITRKGKETLVLKGSQDERV